MRQQRVARDAEEFPVRSNGGDWLIAWHAPFVVPMGTAHGANAFCVTRDAGVVLISSDGERWGWPGGRPEGNEQWEDTLRREVLEETRSASLDGAGIRADLPSRARRSRDNLDGASVGQRWERGLA
jgi:hypothetical protein